MKSTNPLNWADNLEESGMDHNQARAVAQVIHEPHETLMENMREMFAEQTKYLDARFESLEKMLDTKVKGEVATVVRQQTYWLTGIMVALAALLVALD